jgi:enoyl-CoA hydratase/carnithine racemase
MFQEMPPMPSLIEIELKSGIAILRLNRPEKRNAMSDEMRAELVAALRTAAADDAVRALVITGAGKGFCAGGDIAGMQHRLEAPVGQAGFSGWKRQLGVHHAVAMLHRLPKPTLAAVNGAAAGLGADLALACDFVVASSAASFAWSYVHRGLIPDGGGLYFLPRRVGLSRAKELIFSGRAVDANEALTLGIADRLSAPDNLLAETCAWAAEIGAGSATAIALGKSILDQSFELTAEQVFDQGSQAQAVCYTSDEHRSAVNAFLEKTAAKPGAAAKP